jgi:HSP20 family protein
LNALPFGTAFAPDWVRFDSRFRLRKKEGFPMAFGYHNTRQPLTQLREEMDRVLSGFFGPGADGLLPGVFRNQPPVNVWEQGDALLVEMELPGVKNDQIDISVAGGELVVKVERREASDEAVVYHRRERPVGPLTRVVRLPVEVDPDRVAADLHDGVLSIKLPKAESAKPRKINVATKSE